MARRWTLFLIWSLMMTAACSKGSSSKSEDPVEVGYALIDDNKAEEAVDHFQVLVKQEPQNDRYLRGLSSALAFRGGFRIQQLLEPMKQIQRADELKEQYDSVFRKHFVINTEFEQVRNFIAAQIEVVVMVSKVMAVPVAKTDSQNRDLESATSVLLRLNQPEQGDFLYMAILQVLVLKRELFQNLSSDICAMLVQAVESRSQNLLFRFGRILSYLAKAKPSDVETYRNQLTQLQSAMTEISALTKSSSLSLFFLGNAEDDPVLKRFLAPPSCK